MRTKHLLTKTLLAIAGLCVGADAWGFDVPDNYGISTVILGTANRTGDVITSVTPLDFTTAESVTGWTADENVSVSLGNVTEVTKVDVNSEVTTSPTYVSGKCIYFTRGDNSNGTTRYITYNFDAVSEGYLVFNGDLYNNPSAENTSYPNEIRFVDDEDNLVFYLQWANGSGARDLYVYKSDGTSVYNGCSSIYRDFPGYGISDLVVNLNTGACSMTVDYTGRKNSKNTRLQTEIEFNIGTGHSISALKVGRTKSDSYTRTYGTYLDNVSLYHVTPTVSLYTAAFTETNGLSPTVTIYSDSERSSAVENGALTNGTTYYYKAVLTGYNDCTGSFTVSGANPSINFTMTAKAVYNYTVKAVDGSSNLLKILKTGSLYEGESVTLSYPQKILVGNTLYSIARRSSNPRFTITFTPDADDYEEVLSYSEATVSDVICFMEGEDISGVNTGTNVNWASNNKYGYTADNSTFVSVMTLPAGTYQIFTRFDVGNSAGDRYLKFKVGTDEKLSQHVTTQSLEQYDNSEEFTVTSPTTLYFACDGGSATGCDWFYIKGTIDEGADVTGLVVNPGMETAGSGSGFQEYVKGWNNCSVVTNYRRLEYSSSNNTSGAFTGTYAFENWTGETGGLVGQMSQTIQGLPNGVYKLQLAAMSNNVNGQFIYGKSNGKTYKTTISGDNNQANDYEVIVVVEDNQLEIGIDMNNGGATWVAIDNARLTYAPSVSATLGANGYTTFASEYPLDVTTANLPAGVTAYKAAVDEVNKKVNFTALNQTIPANTGILLKGDANATVTIPVVASGTAVTENAFLVNTTGATITSDETTYYFAMVKDSNPLKFGKVTGVVIPANKAYLNASASNFASAPSLIAIFDGGQTTGIDAVKGSEFTVDGKYYNLAGQRVAQPTKGLYIVNGKKVVFHE